MPITRCQSSGIMRSAALGLDGISTASLARLVLGGLDAAMATVTMAAPRRGHWGSALDPSVDGGPGRTGITDASVVSDLVLSQLVGAHLVSRGEAAALGRPMPCPAPVRLDASSRGLAKPSRATGWTAIWRASCRLLYARPAHCRALILSVSEPPLGR